MAHIFRLLNTGGHDGFFNMGMDEALLEAVSRGDSPPVLRFYQWMPPAVSVGYFQGLTEEVNSDACKRFGVDLVRRISGGGAVFHHAELTYSIIMPLGHPLAGKTISESYQILCPGLIEGLSLFGIPAQFVPINDIHTGDRKISGNAQTRRMGCVLQHGTVLLDLETDLMFELLKVPPEKTKGKIIREVKERVTSLRAVLGRNVSFEEAVPVFTEGFRRALSLEFIPWGAENRGSPEAEAPPEPERPTGAEEARARILAAEKFSSPRWLYKR
jgi:lipoate-protein ligase A